MSTVILQGKTQKGKNRVREQGALWNVTQIQERVQFSQLPGPWLALNPVAAQDTRHARWVHATNDADFTVTQLEPFAK